MGQPLFFVLFVATLFSATTFGSIQHIDNVEVDSLPATHQQDFLQTLLNPSKRRALFEETPDFFRVNGFYENEHTQHDFVIKLAHSSAASLSITVDGGEVAVERAPIFHGYSHNDRHTIIAFSFPNVDEGDATPVGMVHHSSGAHFSLSLSDVFGLSMAPLDAAPEGAHPPLPGCNTTSEHHHHSVGEFSKKREAEAYYANAIGLLPLKAIDFVVETDVSFYRIHGYNSKRAVNYIMSLVAATNIMYERDIRASLVVRSIGLHSRNAPTNNLDTLDYYLRKNPSLGRRADVALLLQGSGSGGLAYVGTICLTRNTGHASNRGAYGSRRWDAPEDLIMLSHEVGHILGSPHTHDTTGYNPVIDRCGSSHSRYSIPKDGGSLMSYCHLTDGSVGYTNVKLYLGYVGAFGYHSERVIQRIRATLDSRSCLSTYATTSRNELAPANVTTSEDIQAPVPVIHSCADIPNPRWRYKNGSPLECSTEARLGRCSTTANRAPYCMRSCGRCGGSQIARNSENVTFPDNFISDLDNEDNFSNGTIAVDAQDSNETCTDEMNPTLRFSDALNHTCFELSSVGFCDFVELQAPYCMMSCGRCDALGNSEDDGDDNDFVEDPPQMLFNQGQKCTDNKGILSSRFPDIDSSTRAIDDFTVPAGQTWEIRDVRVMGMWFGEMKGVTRADVSIFHDGKVICRQRAFLPEGIKNTFVVPFNSETCKVVGGHINPEDDTLLPSEESYYITVAPVLNFEEGHNVFFWSFSKSTNGDTFLWKDRSNLLGSSKCNTWTDGTECGFATAGTDLCFQLQGWAMVSTSEDAIVLSQPQLSNDGDGEIGSDSDEGRILSDEEKAAREQIGKYLSELIAQIGSRLEQEAEMVTDIDGTADWVIPVAIALGAVAIVFAFAVIIATVWNLRRGVEFF